MQCLFIFDYVWEKRDTKEREPSQSRGVHSESQGKEPLKMLPHVPQTNAEKSWCIEWEERNSKEKWVDLLNKHHSLPSRRSQVCESWNWLCVHVYVRYDGQCMQPCVCLWCRYPLRWRSSLNLTANSYSERMQKQSKYYCWAKRGETAKNGRRKGWREEKKRSIPKKMIHGDRCFKTHSSHPRVQRLMNHWWIEWCDITYNRCFPLTLMCDSWLFLSSACAMHSSTTSPVSKGKRRE